MTRNLNNFIHRYNAIDHALIPQNFMEGKVNNSKKGAAKDIGQLTKPSNNI